MKAGGKRSAISCDRIPLATSPAALPRTIPQFPPKVMRAMPELRTGDVVFRTLRTRFVGGAFPSALAQFPRKATRVLLNMVCCLDGDCVAVQVMKNKPVRLQALFVYERVTPSQLIKP
jgi:hypothetical protein